MAEIMQEIGKKIKVFRKKRQMTMQELASAIYKSKATISKYEKGQITIDIITLYDIARVLNVQISEFLYHPLPTSQAKTSLETMASWWFFCLYCVRSLLFFFDLCVKKFGVKVFLASTSPQWRSFARTPASVPGFHSTRPNFVLRLYSIKRVAISVSEYPFRYR